MLSLRHLAFGECEACSLLVHDRCSSHFQRRGSERPQTQYLDNVVNVTIRRSCALQVNVKRQRMALGPPKSGSLKPQLPPQRRQHTPTSLNVTTINRKTSNADWRLFCCYIFLQNARFLTDVQNGGFSDERKMTAIENSEVYRRTRTSNTKNGPDALRLGVAS
jgi:hypothetical protein